MIHAKASFLDCAKGGPALKRAGFVEDRQKGSHMMLIHPGSMARTVVPVHPGRTIKEPLLRAIVRDANLSVAEFIELL